MILSEDIIMILSEDIVMILSEVEVVLSMKCQGCPLHQ